VIGASMLAGCRQAQQPAPPPTPAAATLEAPAHSPLMLAAGRDDAVARLPGLTISRDQFLAPLIEGHGLPVLLNVVQLELARQNAQRMGLKLTDADFAEERKRTLAQAFGDLDEKVQQQIDEAVARNDQAAAEKLRQQGKLDHEQLLEQLLTQQRVTRPEFELVLNTNTYLRKIAEQQVKEIPEDTVRKMFDAEYGATVRVRHIQSNNPADLEQAKRRINAGEPFEKVAKEVSRNARTAALGGELPRFGLAHTGIPDTFKQVAFMLKEGEVSNIVQADGAYHLIKLEQKFPPRAVKYETVREALGVKAREQIIQRAVAGLRDQLAEQARNHLTIEDPILREQFARRLQERDKQIKDLEKIKQQQERERQLRQEKDLAAPGADAPAPLSPTPTPTPAPAQPAPAAAPKPAGAQ
jgi:parvulin-like peptidyl-prolyl isomerase